MATTKTRRCIGSARFGIDPHDAPVSEFPKQPSQKDGLGRMCAVHWKAYVKGLNGEREARTSAAEPARGPQRDDTPEYATADEVGAAKSARRQAAEPVKATTKRERRRAPMANKPAPKPESSRVRKARELLAATEKLGGPGYLEAFGSAEVQAALETVNGQWHDPEQADAIETIATEADPRDEDEIRAIEDADAA